MINRNIDKMFDLHIYDEEIFSHSLSIIHIPSSIDKPHVIKNHQTFDASDRLKREGQQRIFVRKGTATYPASKNDLEIMYYDRKNILPEFKLLSSFHVASLTLVAIPDLATQMCTRVKAELYLTIENLGRRPVAINTVGFDIPPYTDPGRGEILHCISEDTIKSQNIIVQPNNLVNKYISVYSGDFDGLTIKSAGGLTQNIVDQVRNLVSSGIRFTLSTR